MTFTMSFKDGHDTIVTSVIEEYMNLLEYYRGQGIAVAVEVEP